MSYADKLRPNSPPDEKAFRSRIFQLRENHSPVALVNAAIDRALRQTDDANVLHGEKAVRLFANGHDSAFPDKENRYLIQLADQKLGRNVDAKALKQATDELKGLHDRLQDAFSQALREDRQYRQTDHAAMRAGRTPPERQSSFRAIFAKIIREELSEEQIDTVLVTNADSYIATLNNAVTIAASEFGLGKATRRGNPR